MNLPIGENIKRLRHKRNLTQEEMAAHLGISFQSISKWERGNGYPDIMFLPSLANYFDISVDELIGMNELAKSEKYTQINCLWEENNKNGLHTENVELMKKSLKFFPNDELLLVQLSTSLEKLGSSDDEKAEHLKESIAVQEQILNYCKDSEIRGATLYNICFAYKKMAKRKRHLKRRINSPISIRRAKMRSSTF